MTVISLASFVVIANHTKTLHDINQSILVGMLAGGNTIRYAPNHHLNEMPLICEVSKLMYQLGLYVVKYDNSNCKCQSVCELRFGVAPVLSVRLREPYRIHLAEKIVSVRRIHLF